MINRFSFVLVLPFLLAGPASAQKNKGAATEHVQTTLDVDLQQAAAEAVRNGMANVDRQLKGRKGIPPGQPQVALIALSAELMREMIACAQELAARKDLDVVLVTGAAGVFSAGADLKDSSRWAGGAPLLEQREIAGLGQRMARAWEELPQITIAAIEGYAVGGGLALAVALDWRVMARDAFVALPEISLGIPLTWGTLPRLVNLVGPARAKRLAILGERVGAEPALAMGLVDELCDPGKSIHCAHV